MRETFVKVYQIISKCTHERLDKGSKYPILHIKMDFKNARLFALLLFYINLLVAFSKGKITCI